MKQLRGFEDPAAYRGGFVAIGNFDGVHRGHQQMIATLVAHARSEYVPAVVFTFDPHPIALLRPEHTPPSLSTLRRKAELLERHKVDCLIAYPTDQALLKLTPDDFFEQIVRRELQARGLVEGPNFYFGRNRAGNVDTLRSFCEAAGLTLDVVEPVEIDGTIVSSSRIRSLLIDGQVAQAVELLGHPYRISGKVARGAARGTSLGFPTANLDDVSTLLPGDGVYAGVAWHGDDRFAAAVHIGPNPTFGEESRKVEVHLLDFSGRLYGEPIDVDFLSRIRGTRRFGSTAELQAQLRNDIEAVRTRVGESSG